MEKKFERAERNHEGLSQGDSHASREGRDGKQGLVDNQKREIAYDKAGREKGHYTSSLPIFFKIESVVKRQVAFQLSTV